MVTPDTIRNYLPETHNRFAPIQREIRKVVSGPVIAYYPGIGGGEEPVDPLSAFIYTGADSVIGVDPFEYPEGSDGLGTKPTAYDFSHVSKEILKHLGQNSHDRTVNTDENRGYYRWSFVMNGRPRELKIRKTTTNALEFHPDDYFNIIYSKRTVGIVDNLPDEVLEKALAIFFTGEGISDANHVQWAGEKLGFSNIDLERLTGRKFDRSRLLVRQTLPK